MGEGRREEVERGEEGETLLGCKMKNKTNKQQIIRLNEIFQKTFHSYPGP